MAEKIDFEMMKQSSEVLLATIDEQLDRAACPVNQTSFPSVGVRERLMALVKIGNANARQLNRKIPSCAQADLHDRFRDSRAVCMANGNKPAEPSLSMSAPLQSQLGEPWARWLKPVI